MLDPVHTPVMLAEILDSLNPSDGEVYVDGTFGAGGYSAGLLDCADCRVIAIDRDADAEKRAAGLQEKYGDRFTFVRGCFGDVAEHLEALGLDQDGGSVDGFVLDIGVSSYQIDEAERGFSFRFDGPLDMRMDRESGQSAADIVNEMEEGDLADLIYQYGEERLSRRIARAIIERRRGQKFSRTSDLADVVRGVVPKSKDGLDPATRTFQALRIAVNDELGELERALEASLSILKPGGRLVVVSFHSLEDSIVKRFMREKSGASGGASRHMPVSEASGKEPLLTLPSKKALKPGSGETSVNPRSRSARLRVAMRTEAAP